jgi:hypothetical protein
LLSIGKASGEIDWTSTHFCESIDSQLAIGWLTEEAAVAVEVDSNGLLTAANNRF